MADALVLAGRPQDFPKTLRDALPLHAFSAPKVRETFERSGGACWVADNPSVFSSIVRGDVHSKGEHRLLLLGPLAGNDRDALLTQFRYVLEMGLIRHLPIDAVAEVLASPRREDLFIGSVSAPQAQVVVLYRGNFRPMVVAKDWFKATPTGTHPDFADVEIIDHGQTVRLGSYEIATEALLYELDPDYRRRMKRQKIEQDKSFGGALRRLRLQKGLSRSDFPGIASKEIARIERSEVAAPRERTLKILSKQLGVPPGEIESF